ncbi:hypothetical protein F5148DRAFT_1177244 [Russula earlei]|uniref:Uncharacterized protein n=1 Tax=Russula earlei TaxID=71964 RepID=A0ACC0UGR7_9AGAM|nr:hypothetical protein F5148DRAFT_1177244 [Russula earlei]
MAFPLPPSTPTDLGFINVVTHSKSATQDVNEISLSTIRDAEQTFTEQQHPTPALGPSNFPPLSPFGSSATHLPTPQSPSNAGPYLNGKNESPAFNGATSPRSALGDSHLASARPQMLTPDSSPFIARNWALQEGATTPTKIRRAPPRTPPLPAYVDPRKEESIRGISGALAESQSAGSPGPSALSSPFMQNALSTSPPHLPTSQSPVRTVGGEIAHIWADEPSARVAQERLTEARRPDYMRRITREDAQSRTNVPGLGIAETPVKGRRIELWGFQESSEESFEERLMAGGYGGYGSTAPERAGTPPVPSRVFDWANVLTSGPHGSSSTVPREDVAPDGPINDREARKRRRLEAFRRVHTCLTTLHPVEVEGKGRVLLDIGAEAVSELLEELQSSTAGKRRGGKKRRRSGPVTRSGKMRTLREEKPPRVLRQGASLNWPDEEFPWNIRTHERRELEAAVEADRMQWIRRFFDENSDAASSEDGVQVEDMPPKESDGLGSPSAPLAHNNVVSSPNRDGTSLQKIFVPSDPADARAALLSKQSVRAVVARRRLHVQTAADSGGEEILCICRGKDDGRELVQCDDCRTWYHLECLGIKNNAELGREEDPWYCHNCVALMNELPITEPTFALAEEETPLDRRRDPLFSEALQDSPAGPEWRIQPLGPGPMTPKANVARAAAVEAYTRSSWGSRHGPHTPRNSSARAERVRVQTTPGPDEGIFQDDISPFDPTSTPSRGMRVGASVGSAFATPPKWQIRVPLAFSPSPYRNGTGPGGVAQSSGPYRMSLHEDTPVDRSAPRPLILPSKRVQESPSMERRGVGRGDPYSQGSPLPLGRKGKERQSAGRRLLDP